MAYISPERINSEQKKYDIRSDIWSYGITLCEVLFNGLPFIDESGNKPEACLAYIHCILHANGEEIVKRVLKNRYSNSLKTFLNLCLKEVKERAKCGDLMSTEFYRLHYSNTTRENIEKYTKNYTD